MKTALIVEEYEPLQKMFMTMAQYYHQAGVAEFQLLFAGSLQEARDVLHARGADAIAFSSSSLPDGRSVELIQELARRGCQQPMIAASGNEDERALQMKAGCQHESAKNVLVEKLAEVMGL